MYNQTVGIYLFCILLIATILVHLCIIKKHLLSYLFSFSMMCNICSYFLHIDDS